MLTLIQSVYKEISMELVRWIKVSKVYFAK